MGKDESSLLWLEDLNFAPLCGTHLGPSWVQGGSGLYQDNSCQRKEGCQRPPKLSVEEVGGSIPPCPRFVFLLPLLLSPPLFSFSPLSFLRLSSIPPCPRFVFFCLFFVCVFGGGVVWCGVLCGCGFGLAWV